MLRPAARGLAVAASAVYLVALGLLTLGPQPESANGGLQAIADLLAAWPPTAWVTYLMLEFLANVVLFIPAGVLVVVWAGGARWWLGPLVGLALSASIEGIQAVALPDRVADVRDLVANTLGALLGAAVPALLTGFRRRTRRRGQAGTTL